MSMIVIQQEKGQKFINRGEKIQEVSIILKGKVAMRTKNDEFIMEKGDGSLDCKKSTYVTFSYNHFWDSGKCNLLGLSEGTTSDLYITYHHNWYDHSDSRHPRCRYYSAHIYNNYYDGNSKYGAGACLLEKNISTRNCMIISIFTYS